jgi:hypothetical protein
VKTHLRRLRIGEQVKAQVRECFAGGDILVEYSGDLVRVLNQTKAIFKTGQTLQLRVIAVEPLAFQLKASADFDSRKIDVSV